MCACLCVCTCVCVCRLVRLSHILLALPGTLHYPACALAWPGLGPAEGRASPHTPYIFIRASARWAVLCPSVPGNKKSKSISERRLKGGEAPSLRTLIGLICLDCNIRVGEGGFAPLKEVEIGLVWSAENNEGSRGRRYPLGRLGCFRCKV